MKETLKGIRIVDFSHRLPGPYSSYLLSKLGAEIIKVEDERFKDPFITGLFPKIDPSFATWYEELNRYKKIHRLNFNDENSPKAIAELIAEADAIIMALPEKVMNKLKINEALEQTGGPKVCLELRASLDNKKSHMHDLNALAETGILSLHLAGRDHEKFIQPPFLPVAGIAFGSQLALQLLASLLAAKNSNDIVWEKVGLWESTETMFLPFWPESLRSQPNFLHNGRYPCYGIYRTKDNHFIALAAVEEKFWRTFCELFQLGELDPFDANENGVKTKIIDLISGLTLEQIKTTIGNHEVCLSIL